MASARDELYIPLRSRATSDPVEVRSLRRRPRAFTDGDRHRRMRTSSDDDGRRARLHPEALPRLSARWPGRTASAVELAAPAAVREAGDSQWTPRLEAMIEEFEGEIERDEWIYRCMVSKAKRWDNAFLIVPAIITSVVGVEGLLSLFTNGCPPRWVEIVAMVLNFLAAIILALSGTWKPGEVSADSLATRVRLLSIKSRIDIALAMEPRDRPPGENFARAVVSDFETATLSAPVPYAVVEREARRRFPGMRSRHMIRRDAWDGAFEDAPLGSGSIGRRLAQLARANGRQHEEPAPPALSVLSEHEWSRGTGRSRSRSHSHSPVHVANTPPPSPGHPRPRTASPESSEGASRWWQRHDESAAVSATALRTAGARSVDLERASTVAIASVHSGERSPRGAPPPHEGESLWAFFDATQRRRLIEMGRRELVAATAHARDGTRSRQHHDEPRIQGMTARAIRDAIMGIDARHTLRRSREAGSARANQEVYSRDTSPVPLRRVVVSGPGHGTIAVRRQRSAGPPPLPIILPPPHAARSVSALVDDHSPAAGHGPVAAAAPSSTGHTTAEGAAANTSSPARPAATSVSSGGSAESFTTPTSTPTKSGASETVV